MHNTGVAFLKIAAKGLLQYFSFGLVPGAVVDGLVDGGEGLCKDIWDKWGKDRREQERQQAIQAVAQVSAAELRQVVAEVVAEVAADVPNQQAQLKSLLFQVQANIRRTMRRPEDPSGTTIPPGLLFDSPQSLLPLIPHKLSRFQSGDRPLKGVDLELVELLGSGGFGEVWQAVNPYLSNSSPVALKFCLDAAAAKTLRNEAALLNQVLKHGKHPGIVELRHTYLSADPAALEYEYVAGGDLTDLIRYAAGGLAPADARAIIRELAETMAFAHQSGIIHRDLKPENILIPASPQPGEPRFKIADFGIGSLQASIAGRATRGHTVGQRLAESMFGSHTPLYSSLEQARGDEPHPADDVFSLGVIWYQLLFGILNEGAPTSRRWPDKLRTRGMLDAEIELLADCFEARPDRPQSANALVERFGKISSRAVTPQKPVERPVQSAPRTVAPPNSVTTPALLIAPFNAPTAQRAQADWARHLG